MGKGDGEGEEVCDGGRDSTVKGGRRRSEGRNGKQGETRREMRTLVA